VNPAAKVILSVLKKLNGQNSFARRGTWAKCVEFNPNSHLMQIIVDVHPPKVVTACSAVPTPLVL